jgi:S-layer homology domain
MTKIARWKSSTAMLLILGITTTTIHPNLTQIVQAKTEIISQNTEINFTDITENYWAKTFIESLASRGIIKGFSDTTFRPEEPVTRAQFAAMLSKAFPREKTRDATEFSDIPSKYWAREVIQESYRYGFLNGYPGNLFKPEEKITKEQVLVALSNGLKYAAPDSVDTVLSYYNDNSQISDYAKTAIAAATNNKIVVNYPQINELKPQKQATRAEVTALIYQALVNNQEVVAINSPYIVNLVPENSLPNTGTTSTLLAIPVGTTIPIRYDKQKILLMPDETVPVTFMVSANINSSSGQTLIPGGSQVIGELQPITGGMQFVAKELVLNNGKKLAINASSQIITKTEQVKKGAKLTNILKDTAIGAAAAAGLAAITGDRSIDAVEVLAGAGTGAILGYFFDREKITLIVVEPNTNLDIKLMDNLIVNLAQLGLN